MSHGVEFVPQQRDLPPFQGLIQNEGRSFTNWGLHRSTAPAIFAEPITYGDVQNLVRDEMRFPSPVNPVGSMLSTSATFVNDGGTMVCLRKLDEVLGLEHDSAGREVVRVQAGCRLKKLNSWLQAHDREIPFQAEIGEATVGSVAAGDTKESSLDGPGYFSAHVTSLTYVDENGFLRTLSDAADGAAFHEFKCSFGLSGIIVECCVETRPATLCRSDVSVEAFATPAELAAALITKRSECDALLALVFLHQRAAFFDQRFKAGRGARTPPQSQPQCDAFRLAKRLAIQHGFDGVEVPEPKGIVYSRADFVNEYWRPAAGERRLDFQYYEHDVLEMERIIAEAYDFTLSFRERTGFAPTGFATYFVQRPERSKKPFGLYSGGRGVSFSFDPICSNPADPLWQQFSRDYNALAIRRLGANASPIQTQWLQKGDAMIPRKLAKPRFTTPYYAQFLG
ncbi:MAG TPA: FAD-binding protein [Methylocella sp.]|nr:FAD-binding protein [Methylocella sp.]